MKRLNDNEDPNDVPKKKKKKLKYHRYTYQMMLNKKHSDALEKSTDSLETFLSNSSKQMRNHSHRTNSRVTRFMSEITYNPEINEDTAFLLRLTIQFLLYFSTTNIMACYHMLPDDKEFLIKYIQENAPKSFVENLWRSMRTQVLNADLTNKVSLHLHTYHIERDKLVSFFQLMKPIIHFFFGQLESAYHEHLPHKNNKEKKNMITNSTFQEYLQKRSYSFGTLKQTVSPPNQQQNGDSTYHIPSQFVNNTLGYVYNI